MIDKYELKILYEEYQNGSSVAYRQLWFLIINFSNFMLTKWLKNLQLSISNDELYDLSIEAALKVMNKICNKDDINDFSGLIYYTTSNVLRDRKNRIIKQCNQISYEDYLKIEGNNETEDM